MHYKINNTYTHTHTTPHHTHTCANVADDDWTIYLKKVKKYALEYYQNSGYLYLNSYTHMNNVQ